MQLDATSNKIMAPCGINCGLCLGYLREKNRCEGCWGDCDKNKPKHCVVCSIKTCEYLIATESKFCYECPKYPCRRLKDLDKRYRLKYNMSNLENLRIIKESGLEAFVRSDREKWRCPKCGGTICVHRGSCLKCGE